MLLEERHQKILEELHDNGKILSSELTHKFKVSEDTIRRDLRILASKGLIHRVHKGALLPSMHSLTYAEKKSQMLEGPYPMIKKAVELIEEGDHIFMDGGTTNEQIARQIPDNINLTIITNSPPVITVLHNKPKINVIIPEGVLLHREMVIVGPKVMRLIKQTRVEKYFIGICSIHLEEGISSREYQDAQIKQAMLQNAAQVIGLAPIQKIGTISNFHVSSINALTKIIVEPETYEKFHSTLQQQGIQVIHY
jgi:DeoR/GlpR family transcriptional regulator of sugar metabolism